MKKRLRSFLGNLTVLVCTLALFFGGIEATLRFSGIDKGLPKTPPIYEKSLNPAISYQLKPDLKQEAFRSTVITDRRGFRSPEIRPGRPTIALLGDSIAFGYGLENDQTIGARLEALLEGKYNVVTAAAPGYGLGQESVFFREKVLPLHPGTLILEFHWNDLTSQPPDILDDEGNLHAHDWKPGDRPCNPLKTGILSWIPGGCWLDLHSAFYRTIKKVVTARTEQRNAAEQVTNLAKNAFGDEVTDEQLAAYGKQLEDFAATLPPELKKLFVIWPERPLHLLTTTKLRAMAEKNGFRVINLYEVFGNRAETLTWDTVHPSAKTADEAAGVIRGALEEWALLPE